MEAYYTIQTPGHHSALFSELHVLQKQGVLCDVILAAEDGEVMAHKVVLMAASKYFREKLSPLVSPVPSRICLKGISVVELANLVKYIYTGKLLVAKETMDVTLEVSEILELNGVTQGYKDIVEYERMKKVGELARQASQSSSSVPMAVSSPGPTSLSTAISSPAPNNLSQAVASTAFNNLSQAVSSQAPTNPSPGIPSQPATSFSQAVPSSAPTSQSHAVPSQVPTSHDLPLSSTYPFSLSQAAVPDNIDNPTMIGKSVTVTTTSATPSRTATPTAPNPPAGQSDSTQPIQPQEIRVTELCEDGSEITYTLDQSSEYPFEGNPYDQQYMDVSVGAKGMVSPATAAAANAPPLQKMVKDKADQAVLDEQAQHQDLLAVAIETLSGSAPAVRPQEQPLPTVIQEVETETTPHQQHVAATAKQNGKIESKIVTLNAGTVANELGGQTSVYTVALDPASIKKPLLMPRVLKKKTEKEKQAEMIAKMYRKKKAELRKRVIDPPSNACYREVMANSLTTEIELAQAKGRTMPRILLRSASPRGKQTPPTDKQQHIRIHRSKDGSVTTTKLPGASGVESGQEAVDDKGEFGQVVNFDSDNEADTDDKGRSGQQAVQTGGLAGAGGKTAATNTSLPATTAQAAREGRTGREKKTMDTSVGSCKQAQSSIKKTVFIDEHGNVLEVQTENTNMAVTQQNKKAPGFKQPENPTKEASHVDAEQEVTPVKENKGDDHDHLEHLRSSAAKRKGKVPRRLPLPDNEETVNVETKVSSATVRTRKNSKTENSESRTRITRSKTSVPEDTVPDEQKETAEVKNVGKDSPVVKADSSPVKSITPKKTPLIEKIKISPSVRLMRLSEAEIRKNTSPKKASEVKVQKTTSASQDSGVIEMEIEEYYGETGTDTAVSTTEPASSVPCSSQDSPDSESEDDMEEMEELDLGTPMETAKSNSQTEATKPDGKQGPKNVETGEKNNSQTTATSSKLPDGKDGSKQTNNDTVSKGATSEDVSRGTKRKLPNDGEGTPSKMTTRTRSKVTAATLKKAEEIKSEKPSEVVLETPEKWADGSEKVAVKQEPLVDIESEYDCTECGEMFPAGFDLAAHQLQRHNLPLPKYCHSYRCPVCGYVEDSYKTVDEHMAQHEGSHVPCIKCEKKFKTYSEMKKHMIAHSEKRHKCPHCDFVSNVMACVTMHVKLKHSQDMEVTKCLFCNYKTPLPGNLRKHYTTAHNLIVVTKQSLENRKKYRDYEEGALVTLDGRLFDPEVMPVPKMSQRHFKQEKDATKKEGRKAGSRGDRGDSSDAASDTSSVTDKITLVVKRLSSSQRDNDKQSEADSDNDEAAAKKRGRKPALYKLPMEEFTKEVLKRHNEFLSKPEKPLTFMSNSLAIATEHPSFPQASPSVRRTKADKIYYSVRPQLRFQDLTSSQQYIHGVGASEVPSAVNEIEVIHDSNVTMDSETNMQTVLSISDQHGPGSDEQQMIVVTRDGHETVMDPKDFYNALVEKGDTEETRETIEMINQLLAAGQEIQIQEKAVEIQNM